MKITESVIVGLGAVLLVAILIYMIGGPIILTIYTGNMNCLWLYVVNLFISVSFTYYLDLL